MRERRQTKGRSFAEPGRDGKQAFPAIKLFVQGGVNDVEPGQPEKTENGENPSWAAPRKPGKLEIGTNAHKHHGQHHKPGQHIDFKEGQIHVIHEHMLQK